MRTTRVSPPNLPRILFEQTRPLHNLDDENLLLLEMGSLLHDIGHFINSVDHDKHGYYLLNTNRLIGLAQREQNIVANLVRYHRQEFPSTKDENLKSLSQKDHQIIRKLSALLRLADSIDMSHTGHVQDVKLKETKSGWQMKILGKNDMELEMWYLAKRKTLFQKVFGVNLNLELE